MALETTSERPAASRLEPPPPSAGRLLPAFDSGALRLLSCGAFAVLLVGLLVLASGPSESDETLSWVLAFAVALPCGLVLAAYQERLLARAAPAAPARALAAGLVLLGLALLVRRVGAADLLHHALIVLAAAAALASPFLAGWRWRDPNDDAEEIARAIAFVSIVSILLLFVPRGALLPGAFVPALALTAAAFGAIRLTIRWRLSKRARRTLDVVLCGAIALAVVQLPDIRPYFGNVLLHHSFFLGPANDVLHGQAMLVGTWSQYGVGVIDALALTFSVVPIGFGTFALLIAVLTAAQYVCVYAILRLAGLGQPLALIVIAAAALGNLFAPLETYVAFPSDSPLRFGLPYLIVLFAVLASRYPARARPARLAVLAVLAVSATWSFEVFVYCGATYGALALVGAMWAGTDIVRRVIRAAAIGLAVSAVAMALFSLLTLAISGELDWGPYFEYLQLYSVNEFSQLPVDFFSPGPLMAAAIFLSAVTLLWLSRACPWALTAPMRTALAGLTGLAVVTFTYYLGRSHPNNLLVLLVPAVALGGLWMQVLLSAPAARWRSLNALAIVLALAMIAVAGWSSVSLKRGSTALVLAVPGGKSLPDAVELLADNPVLDPRAPVGAALLAEHLPSGAPALVLLEPDLTTETLMRAGRRNLLPISHPPEDDLIDSSEGRVRAASRQIPEGTLLLVTSPARGGRQDPDRPSPELVRLQQAALSALRRRFEFRSVQRTSEGLELVRLVNRR